MDDNRAVSRSMTMAAHEDSGHVYTRLGVRPLINCAGVRTIHGNSLMLPEVRAAMEAAAHGFVLLDELMEAVSRRLAELTGAEAGIVTAGSAAALCLAAAACVAGNDPDRMLALPDTRGLPNRVLIPAGQRLAYDHAIRMTGCVMIEVAHTQALAVEIERGGVAMICVLSGRDRQSSLRFDDIVAAARPRGIPIVVDAASDFPQRPDPWLARGADMVIYSGGKYLRGPASSGLLLGRHALVAAAWANAAPHQAIGRPMKISKEQIVGTLAAVEHWFFKRDAQAIARQWHDDLGAISEAVAMVDGLNIETIEGDVAQPVPRLRLRWDRSKIFLSGLKLRARLLDGEPRILIEDIGATDDSVLVNPFGLRPSEAAIVGVRLREALASSGHASQGPEPARPAQLGGRWDVVLRFRHGSGHHEFQIAQNGRILTGAHNSALFATSIGGESAGALVWLRSRHPCEGVEINYSFTGTVANDTMSGTFLVGSAGEANKGPIADGQFGGGEWMAHRLASD